MSTTAAIDEAVITRLQGDATLLALAPGGIWPDSAPESLTSCYVLVTLQIETPVHQLGGIAYLVARLQVSAIAPSLTSTTAKAAADRVDVMLHGARFTITGQTYLDCKRVERFGYSEQDGPLVWQHRGFDYEVWSS